ncbi:MAG: hypothetical protein EOP53_17335 [Sphingobacteriales bacterium]|nr:MAG: hypothetical protein EOP53_17335 [Sphingobacteriales bacterium]
MKTAIVESLKEGEFVKKYVLKETLILRGQQFIYYREKGYPNCCDTLSKGNYQLDTNTGLVYLTSYPFILKDSLSAFINEEYRHGTDSTIITITNPVEAFNDGSNRKSVRFYYQCNFYLSKKDNKRTDEVYVKYFDSPSLVFRLSSDFKIDSFAISAVPNYPNLSLRYNAVNTLKLKTYTVKSESSNHFSVNIPGLTFDFLAYKRLNKDIVRIIDNNTLEWDGFYYVRQGISK